MPVLVWVAICWAVMLYRACMCFSMIGPYWVIYDIFICHCFIDQVLLNSWIWVEVPRTLQRRKRVSLTDTLLVLVFPRHIFLLRKKKQTEHYLLHWNKISNKPVFWKSNKQTKHRFDEWIRGRLEPVILQCTTIFSSASDKQKEGSSPKITVKKNTTWSHACIVILWLNCYLIWDTIEAPSGPFREKRHSLLKRGQLSGKRRKHTTTGAYDSC